jgi:Fructose/tagatose bisphosphate aldolase
MIHETTQSLQEAMRAAGVGADGTLSGDGAKVRERAIDDLIYTAVFSRNDDAKKSARVLIHQLARQLGAVPATIQPLYDAFGRKELSGFTVPAHNFRTITYDSCRALFRAAIKNGVGPFIFEIARSEIGYTEQRPAEYAACVLAAAIKESYRGPVFIQGDHFQASAKKWKTPEGKQGEVKAIEALIDEAIAAGFYNIDIDTSTLVDLSFPTRDEQQHENYAYAAHFTKYIREREPKGITISVGGEIGEVGKHNTSPDEFRAYMEGYLRTLGKELEPISKISIQTGTSHGGVPLADGTIAKAKIDFDVLKAISDIGRSEYHIGGSVQHGASTLPEEVFHKFPEADTLEIHLATGFQNMVYDAPSFPADLRKTIEEWCRVNAADERKDGETDEQFLYKTRKKALGPFKKTLWDMPASAKQPIIDSLEAKFAFLFGKLGVKNTKAVIDKYVPVKAEDLPKYVGFSDAMSALATVDPNEGE